MRNTPGRQVRDGLVRAALGEHVPDLAERTVYVAGSPAMVTATRRILRLLGVRKVKVDAFSGY